MSSAITAARVSASNADSPVVLPAEGAFPCERISWRRVFIKVALKGREKKRAKAMIAILKGSLGKPRFAAIFMNSSLARMVFSIGTSIGAWMAFSESAP